VTAPTDQLSARNIWNALCAYHRDVSDRPRNVLVFEVLLRFPAEFANIDRGLRRDGCSAVSQVQFARLGFHFPQVPRTWTCDPLDLETRSIVAVLSFERQDPSDTDQIRP
jgi:hypothetical protein